MRLWASKNIGHGVRIGTSADVAKIISGGSKKRGKISKAQEAALAKHAAVIVDLERRASEADRQTAVFAHRVSECDIYLAEYRPKRAEMAAALPTFSVPEQHETVRVALVKVDAGIVKVEANRTEMEALMRTSMDEHESLMGTIAECRRVREAILRQL